MSTDLKLDRLIKKQARRHARWKVQMKRADKEHARTLKMMAKLVAQMAALGPVPLSKPKNKPRSRRREKEC